MKYRSLLGILLALLLLCGCTFHTANTHIPQSANDEIYTIQNNNQPEFTDDQLTAVCFEEYSELDFLGRCGVAFACIGKEIMPTEERGTIGQVKPSGWHTVKYDGVDGKYLYNRCHLIGYQLAGENANPKNLITGTRYLNNEGMLPFENQIAEYVETTGNHVLYRVTPVFEGNNLLASGVQMEAKSVEDNGKGICFNVYCFNIQPGIEIDYATGDSQLKDSTSSLSSEQSQQYVLNTNSKKYHLPTCDSTKQMKEENKQEYTGTVADLAQQGYSACKSCNP